MLHIITLKKSANAVDSQEEKDKCELQFALNLKKKNKETMCYREHTTWKSKTTSEKE